MKQEQKNKYTKAAVIAKQKGASIPTTAEMLIRMGRPLDAAMTITVDVYYGVTK